MNSTYTVLVTGSVTQSQAHLSAIRFIHAAVKQGHRVGSVFFYEDAVAIADRFVKRPSDELAISDTWLALAQKQAFELQVCVAAASRRGIVVDESAIADKEHSKAKFSLLPGFSLLGLGQLAGSLSLCENKFVHFK